MAEEKLEEIRDFLTTMQLEGEELRNGFEVQFRGEEFVFLAKITDRNDKKMSALLTGVMDGCLLCEVG